MIRVVAIIALLTSVEAYRVKTQEIIQSTNNFFESCEDLQVIFRRRVAAVQDDIVAHPNATGMSSMSRARFIMRTVGVVRTMRRARERECPWAVEGNGEDIEKVQAIVQAILVGNPCAEAALAELTPEAFEAAVNELIPLQRAMLVLVSATCEVAELEVVDLGDEQTAQESAAEAEQQMQDTIDELFEEAALERESGVQTSLVQSESFLDNVFAWVGAIFLALFFGMACATVTAFAGLIVGFFLGFLFLQAGPRFGEELFMVMQVSGFTAGALGFASCAGYIISPLLP